MWTHVVELVHLLQTAACELGNEKEAEQEAGNTDAHEHEADLGGQVGTGLAEEVRDGEGDGECGDDIEAGSQGHG